jgi:hypothetical protein
MIDKTAGIILGVLMPGRTKGSLKNNFTFYTPMHPAWRRCESSEYPDIPAFSRLASQAPQRLKLRTYFFVNPKLPSNFHIHQS